VKTINAGKPLRISRSLMSMFGSVCAVRSLSVHSSDGTLRRIDHPEVNLPRTTSHCSLFPQFFQANGDPEDHKVNEKNQIADLLEVDENDVFGSILA